MTPRDPRLHPSASHATSHLLVDAGLMASAIRTAARAGIPPVLTHRALQQLEAELGGKAADLRWLLDLAGETGRPVLVNLPAADGGSQTVGVAPQGWSQERLVGSLAGLHQELEAEFGPIDRQRTGGAS